MIAKVCEKNVRLKVKIVVYTRQITHAKWNLDVAFDGYMNQEQRAIFFSMLQSLVPSGLSASYLGIDWRLAPRERD